MNSQDSQGTADSTGRIDEVESVPRLVQSVGNARTTIGRLQLPASNGEPPFLAYLVDHPGNHNTLQRVVLPIILAASGSGDDHLLTPGLTPEALLAVVIDAYRRRLAQHPEPTLRRTLIEVLAKLESAVDAVTRYVDDSDGFAPLEAPRAG